MTFFDDLERQLVTATPDRARRVRRARARTAATLSAVLVALLAGGVGIATAVSGGGDAPGGAPATTAPQTQTTAPIVSGTVPRPGTYTVAILNGTTVPGLARGVANRLQNAKFKIGNVTNAATQDRATTTVYFSPRYVAAGRWVAETLGLPRTTRRPLTRAQRVIAGEGAAVVVIVGSDQNTAPVP
jgi:hypothetical protein